MSSLFESTYNPDVLSCIANLSNDEVFTPPEIANQVLDMLPVDIWRDPNITFLDPAAKSGVFLREIAKRLIDGLEDAYPDLEERLEHIYRKQLFGIALTELTSLLSRRSLYCSKYPNSVYSVVRFDEPEGRIRYKNHGHNWHAGRCKYCGASQREYERDGELETYAYEFIHLDNPEEVYPVKFDVIIGNPPYQLSDGGQGASAMPIYQKFVCQAMKLQPRYLTMIIPARWYSGGRNLEGFRNEMLTDDRIRVLHDFPDASECFPGVEIKGGVCFFLWERDSRGECEIHSHVNNTETVSVRPLLEPGLETFIRKDAQVSILNKVRAKGESVLASQLNAGRYFGFHTRVVWDEHKARGELQTADGAGSYPVMAKPTNQFDIKVYIAHGECWIKKENVTRNTEQIDRYKVIIPEAGNPSTTILGKPKISEPGSCSSNTYIVYLAESEAIAAGLISYLKTKFVRYLVAMMTSTQHMPPRAYSLVPTQDFTRIWSDEDLYKMYELDDSEINEIELSIAAME